MPSHRAPAKPRWLANPSTGLTSLLVLLGFLSLTCFDAQALSLGAVRVLSSLGEPLRAEVNLIDLTEAEANSFWPSLGKSEAYASMGLDYNPDFETMQFNLERSPDGRAVLQLSNSQPVTSVFVDIVLEVSWASGKVTRNFTLLLTPPTSDSVTAPVAPVLPMATAASPAEPVAAPAAKKRVSVVRGDTAGQLAMKSLPVNVSLDQMLLAMLRSSPDAFVAGNVNRLKTGAVLAIPTAADATSVARAEARQIITAQSRDFNAFRQQLGSNAQPAQVTPSGREATGQVQSSVTEKTPVASAADKLTLSKGALKGTGTPAGAANAEEKLAQESQAKEAAERLSELAKNISDLNKLSVTPPAPAGPASEPTPATASPAAPTLAVVAPPAVAAAARTTDQGRSGLIDRLATNPLVLPAAAGFLGLLLAWGWIRWRRNAVSHKSDLLGAVPDDDSLARTAVEPRLDAASPAQSSLDKASLPPFEADALKQAQTALDFGREAEAESLLREALSITPQRLALHLELMGIYNRRSDASSFEKLASAALTLTAGQGADWGQICKNGRALDPTNPLYQPATATDSSAAAPPFDKLDFDLELGLDAPDKAPPRTKS